MDQKKLIMNGSLVISTIATIVVWIILNDTTLTAISCIGTLALFLTPRIPVPTQTPIILKNWKQLSIISQFLVALIVMMGVLIVFLGKGMIMVSAVILSGVYLSMIVPLGPLAPGVRPV